MFESWISDLLINEEEKKNIVAPTIRIAAQLKWVSLLQLDRMIIITSPFDDWH